PLGVLSAFALQNHHFARNTYGEIWFGGHDQGEGLCWGGSAQFALSILIDKNLSRITGASLRRDGPEHICEELGTEVGWCLHTSYFDLHSCPARVRFDLDFCFATCLGHQFRALQIDFGAASSDLVADGGGRLRNHAGW